MNAIHTNRLAMKAGLNSSEFSDDQGLGRRMSGASPWLVCALFTLTFCSCQSVTTGRGTAPVAAGGEKAVAVPVRPGMPAPTPRAAAPMVAPPVVPGSTAASLQPAPIGLGHPGTGPLPAVNSFAPCPHCRPVANGWGPACPTNCLPGDGVAEFAKPPEEEYVCNGGDQNVLVQVKRDWSVQGLHDGDTVVHYDTTDGQTLVQPSNPVCLYAPRFAAVRKVYGLVAHEQHDRVAGVELPVAEKLSTDRVEPTTVTQPLQPIRRHTVTAMQGFRDKTLGVGLDNAQRPAVAEDEFLPFEDLAIMRRGVFDNSEKARLSQRLLAAVTWTHGQGPQIVIDNKTAIESTGTSGSQSVYTYEIPPGKSRLRVVKIASKQNAKPGELVEFTLRIDNVGDQLLGNVTVIDRLHDRLEYLIDSQRCSVQADFLTEDESGSPRVLRWEIKDPIPVGQGGLIRFSCRVR